MGRCAEVLYLALCLLSADRQSSELSPVDPRNPKWMSKGMSKNRLLLKREWICHTPPSIDFLVANEAMRHITLARWLLSSLESSRVRWAAFLSTHLYPLTPPCCRAVYYEAPRPHGRPAAHCRPVQIPSHWYGSSRTRTDTRELGDDVTPLTRRYRPAARRFLLEFIAITRRAVSSAIASLP